VELEILRIRTKLIPAVLGTLLVLGIPPLLTLILVFSPQDNFAAAHPKNPLRALLARQSNPTWRIEVRFVTAGIIHGKT
jgi:hypothetical protein